MKPRPYSSVDEVEAGMHWSNTGRRGWSCTLWSDLIDDEAPHREFLESFIAHYPDTGLSLPDYDRYEDYVSGRLLWNGHQVEVYYETIVSRLTLWSPTRDVLERMRQAVVELQS